MGFYLKLQQTTFSPNLNQKLGALALALNLKLRAILSLMTPNLNLKFRALVLNLYLQLTFIYLIFYCQEMRFQSGANLTTRALEIPYHSGLVPNFQIWMSVLLFQHNRIIRGKPISVMIFQLAFPLIMVKSKLFAGQM